VKDLAAGAVLVLCIASAALGLILFLPKLARL
jgi:diacylglycerol kinase